MKGDPFRKGHRVLSFPPNPQINYFRAVKMKALIRPLTDRMRRRRFRFFMEQIRSLPRPLTILDLGGTEAYWENMGLQTNDVRIILLNLEEVPVKNPEVFQSVQGDATDLSTWADQSVDLVFSNSVIEHLFTRAQQQKMAHEVQRVGKSFFIQTPNYFFPIEPHWLIPGFQFMPRSWRIGFTRVGAWGHMPQLKDPAQAAALVDEVQLLTPKAMQALFPGASVYKEFYGGWIKSISCYRIAAQS